MTATVAALEIRPLARTGEDPAIIAELARLMADAYPIMGISTAMRWRRTPSSLRSWCVPTTPSG